MNILDFFQDSYEKITVNQCLVYLYQGYKIFFRIEIANESPAS